MPRSILTPIYHWFSQQGWEPLAFQQETWSAYLAGKSGIIQVPTGSGKTYAAVMGPVAQMLSEVEKTGKPLSDLQLLYITPLRSLSRDIEASIRRPIEDMGWPITVASRTGDTKAAVKTHQIKKNAEYFDHHTRVASGAAVLQAFGKAIWAVARCDFRRVARVDGL